MKVYVRAPYEEACLAELNELFDEVVYEPWTTTGQRYYEDEMLQHLLAGAAGRPHHGAGPGDRKRCWPVMTG